MYISNIILIIPYMLNVKKILLLEDEYSVISKFVKICEDNNEQVFINWSKEGTLLSLVLDSSGTQKFDLKDFDAIFVDRDNALSKEGNFHWHFLRLFQDSSGRLDDLSKKVYPMSGNWLNNTYLINEIIKILINSIDIDSTINSSTSKTKVKDNNVENIYYIGDRDTQLNIEELLKNNTFTKSFDGFDQKIAIVLKSLTESNSSDISNLEVFTDEKNITNKKTMKLI